MPTAPIRDIVLYYEDTGAGDALVLITGVSGDSQAWALQVRELSKSFRVITFDNRGSGRSSSPDKPYSIANMAADTAGLLAHLGIARAHVVGWSMGAMIALELAATNPALVDKLVLVGAAPSLDGQAKAILRSWIDVRRSNMSREQFVRFTSTFLYSPELLDDEARYERAIANSLANPHAQQDHAFFRQANAVLGFDITDRAGAIKQEALIVTGVDDILVPARNGARLAKLLSKATVRELPGGHAGCIEYPGEYSAAFREFLGAS